MECNKDDAIKAREVAERKLNAKDVAGAKKFALKARALFPELEGISQFLSILRVYESAENDIYGEADLYGILDLKPPADDDTIRKHYRKLALMLHPDKNKSVGAEGAFKLVSEAWSLLSDKNKRAAYDARQNRKGFPLKAKTPLNKTSCTPPASNGFCNFGKTGATSNPKVHKNSSHANGSSSGSTSKTNSGTFWTVCHGCVMSYEYERIYLHHNLLCLNCQKSFFAVETKTPILNGSKLAKPWNSAPQYPKKVSNVKPNSGKHEWSPFSGDSRASSVAQAANVVQQTYEKVKRVREEAQAARKREKAAKRKGKSYNSDNMGISSVEKKGRVNMCINNKQMGPGVSRFNNNRELTQMELRNILMFKARKEIIKKISEWSSVENAWEKEKVIEKRLGKAKTVNVEVNNDRRVRDVLDKLSISVHDSDFYDFDKNRTERAFLENQVWAIYDNDDGMPRYYAMVSSIISSDPFRIRISWLNTQRNTDMGPINRVKACGDFLQGKHETCDSLNCFSHKVRWTKGNDGAIRIFPRKGDVWGLYRNWSPNWDGFTPGEERRKYEMVEVLDDYDEELGVVVIPLVKVAGFKGVFHQHLDPKQAKRIPKDEIFRFAYQAPSHSISGQEALNAPKGCRELDPAALPVEFLQVIADVKDEYIDVNQACISARSCL